MSMDRIAHPMQPFFDDRPRHCQIQTDKALRVADKHGIATLQQNTGLVGKKHRQILHIGQAAVQIHPGEIGSLRGAADGARKVGGEILGHQPEIIIQVAFELLQPIAAALVSGLRRRERERIDQPDQPIMRSHLVSDLGITDNDVGKHQSGQVEGLAGRHAGDEFGIVRQKLGGGNVFFALPNQVAVDFVGNQPQSVLLRDSAYPLGFFLRPHPAAGVVRIAPEEEFRLGVRRFSFQIFKINGKPTRVIIQGGTNQFPAVENCGMFEKTVSWSGDQQLFIRRHQIADQFV